MAFFKISVAVLLLIQYASAIGLGGDIGENGALYGAPKPFAVAYQADGDGGASFMSEEGDASGNVRGSYGYRDDQGLYRLVENSAGQGGFQAAVKINEPGVEGKENPTDVIMNVQQAPEAIQDKYTRVFTGFGAWSAGGRMSSGKKEY